MYNTLNKVCFGNTELFQYVAIVYLLATVSTEPTLLISTETAGRIKQVVTVEPDGSCFDAERRL